MATRPAIAMKATVIKPFKGCPDGSRKPKQFVPDDRLDGDLARVAVSQGWAKPDPISDKVEQKSPPRQRKQKRLNTHDKGKQQ